MPRGVAALCEAVPLRLPQRDAARTSLSDHPPSQTTAASPSSTSSNDERFAVLIIFSKKEKEDRKDLRFRDTSSMPHESLRTRARRKAHHRVANGLDFTRRDPDSEELDELMAATAANAVQKFGLVRLSVNL